MYQSYDTIGNLESQDGLLEFYHTKKAARNCGLLFDLLLQIAKQIGIEELLNGDVQTVAELLDGGDRSGFISTTDNIMNGRLCHAAHNT